MSSKQCPHNNAFALAAAAVGVAGIAAGGLVAYLALTKNDNNRAPRSSSRCCPHNGDASDDEAPRMTKKSQYDGEENSQVYEGWSMEEARAHCTDEASKAEKRKPAEVLADLQRGNARFWTGTASRPEVSAFERRALIMRQYPSTVILGCSDSRVPIEIVFDQGLGDLFVVRCAGNALGTTTTASVEYAVVHLGCKVLMVMGHEGCGAVKAARLPADKIAQETPGLRGLLSDIKAGLDEPHLLAIGDNRARDREAVVTNVKKQVEKLTQEPALMKQVQAKELIIVGAFYEISSGIVDFCCEVSEGGDIVSYVPQSARNA